MVRLGIFEPFRALGYITDNVPFVVQRRGIETFVTVSVGKSFQIFNTSKLSLVFVGSQLEKKIRSLACWRDYTYAASGRSIFVFRRAHQVSEWCVHESKVVHLLCLGNFIVSVDAGGWLFVWEVTNLTTDASPLRKIHLEEGVSPTCLMHPDTYLNKVVVGTEEGYLFLCNVSTGKILYKFMGWGSPIRCCTSSPALDVVAIGCADGKVHLHNLRFDECVVTFNHMTRGSVTAVSFRTDGQPILSAGGSSGVISIWNLEKQKLQAVIKDAHDSIICALHFFQNEPVLLSAGADNSLKMWIFDSNDGEARLLRFRSGHSAPPTCMRYYGTGRHILSAGQDRTFRIFSTIQDQQSRELSQGHVAKKARKLRLKEEDLKLPPVTCFDAAEIRERDWCNVVTCHVDESVAYSWRLQNYVIGEHILKPTVEECGSVYVCSISSCGNFAVLGTTLGHVERFNLQSGLSRQIYYDVNLSGMKAHTGSVVGIVCDATNTLLITGGYDGYVKVWDFKGGKLQCSWSIGSQLVKMDFHRGSGLLVTASDDLVVRVYDVISAKIVRQFDGPKDRITDVCFSADGKWILLSSMDGTIRIWDVIASKQLDAMRMDDPVTCVSLSPNMDMLATTHVAHNGIYLWGNRFIYSGVLDSGRYGSGEDVVKVSMPSLSSPELAEDENSAQDVTLVSPESQPTAWEVDELPHKPQIMPELVTLSLLPKSQWQSLVKLDIIKMRNKPIEPPKKPEKAPFFLPTMPSLSGDVTFTGLTETAKDKKGKVKPLVVSRDGDEESPFLSLLRSSSESGDFGALLSFLKGLSPAEIDVEFQMLRILDDSGSADVLTSKQLNLIGNVLDFLVEGIQSNRDFEFVQALIRLFLKIHGESILHQPFLQEKTKRLLNLESASWQRLDHMFQNVRCTLSFLSNSLY